MFDLHFYPQNDRHRFVIINKKNQPSLKCFFKKVSPFSFEKFNTRQMNFLELSQVLKTLKAVLIL